jgi:hypothetical protein
MSRLHVPADEISSVVPFRTAVKPSDLSSVVALPFSFFKGLALALSHALIAASLKSPPLCSGLK